MLSANSLYAEMDRDDVAEFGARVYRSATGLLFHGSLVICGFISAYVNAGDRQLSQYRALIRVCGIDD